MQARLIRMGQPFQVCGTLLGNGMLLPYLTWQGQAAARARGQPNIMRATTRFFVCEDTPHLFPLRFLGAKCCERQIALCQYIVASCKRQAASCEQQAAAAAILRR